MVEAKSAIASSGRHCGHTGEQLPWLQEVLRFGQRMYYLQCSREREEHKPQRSGEIRHHARQEHRTVNRVHTLHQEQTEVHQVTVAPAAVTF